MYLKVQGGERKHKGPGFTMNLTEEEEEEQEDKLGFNWMLLSISWQDLQTFLVDLGNKTKLFLILKRF